MVISPRSHGDSSSRPGPPTRANLCGNSLTDTSRTRRQTTDAEEASTAICFSIPSEILLVFQSVADCFVTFFTLCRSHPKSTRTPLLPLFSWNQDPIGRVPFSRCDQPEFSKWLTSPVSSCEVARQPAASRTRWTYLSWISEPTRASKYTGERTRHIHTRFRHNRQRHPVALPRLTDLLHLERQTKSGDL